MKHFLFLLTIGLFAFNAAAQDCPVRVFSFSQKASPTDSSYIKNVLLENDSCSTHIAILLETEIILSIKASDHDRVYMISRLDGKVTHYFQVYADGKMYSYPLNNSK